MSNPLPDWLAKWWRDYDTGVSSMTIASVLSSSIHLTQTQRLDAPHDPADVGRCVRLLDLACANGENWRARMGEVAAACPAWAPLVPRWGEIEAEFRDQLAREREDERERWRRKDGGMRKYPKPVTHKPSRCWWLVATLRGSYDPYDYMNPHPFRNEAP